MMQTFIDLGSPFIWTFAFGSFLSVCWGRWLQWRNQIYSLRNEDKAHDIVSSVHPEAGKLLSRARLKKALSYQRTYDAFRDLRRTVYSSTWIFMLVFGIAPFVMQSLVFSLEMPVCGAACIAAASLFAFERVISLPFRWHQVFGIERRFEFCNTAKKLFWTDESKEFFVDLVVKVLKVASIVFALQCVHAFYGKIDWKACLCLAVLSSIAVMLFEIVQLEVIMPMFSKLKPMEESPLKERMLKLVKMNGFSPEGVFIIDESKRSKHSNAFCAGWGKSKKLVIDDTMLETMSEDEILFIIGHELAHAKLHHLAMSRLTRLATTFAFLLVSSIFIYDLDLLHAFGFRLVDDAVAWSVIGFWLFKRIYNSFIWLLDGAFSWMSRKMEFAADRNSVKMLSSMEGKDFIDIASSSLVQLYCNNLSWPLADSLYEAWNFGHPGFINRIKALKKNDLK